MIQAINLHRTYVVGEVEINALRPVDVTIEDREFVAIVGKSGAGKSTLLHQLGLLDYPSGGTVCLDGADTALLTNRERTQFRLHKLGYVFQDYALLPELTAEDNIAVPLMMQGYDYDVSLQRAREVLERVGLEPRRRNLPGQLSGGEKQRVSIGRAIANKPLILFADEPTANLDTETSGIVLEYLKELNRDGQTIIMVTHERDYSEQAGRIIEMSDGRVVADTKHAV